MFWSLCELPFFPHVCVEMCVHASVEAGITAQNGQVIGQSGIIHDEAVPFTQMEISPLFQSQCLTLSSSSE